MKMGRERIDRIIQEIERENYTEAMNIIEAELKVLASDELLDLKRRVEERLRHTMTKQCYKKFYESLYKEEANILSIVERKLRTIIGKRTRNLINNMSKDPRYQIIENEIRQKGYRNILDVGCAEGHFSITLGARNPHLNVIGIDVVDYNIKKAMELNRFNNVKFIVGFAEDVNVIFPCGTFDLVMLFEILEHVISLEDVLDAAYEVLRENGMIAITVPEGIDNPGHIRYFSDEFIINNFGYRKGFSFSRIYPFEYDHGVKNPHYWKYITFLK